MDDIKKQVIDSVIEFFDIYNIDISKIPLKIDIKYGEIKKIIYGNFDYNSGINNIYINKKLYNNLDIDEKIEYNKMIYNTLLHELTHNILYRLYNNMSEILPIEIQQKFGKELNRNLFHNIILKSGYDLHKKSILERYIEYKDYKDNIYRSILNEYNNNIINMRLNIINHYGDRYYDLDGFISETEYGAIFLDNLDNRDKLVGNDMLTDISRSSFGFIFNTSLIMDNINIDMEFREKFISDMIEDITNISIDRSIYLEDIKNRFISLDIDYDRSL